jgi:hypothetical protein
VCATCGLSVDPLPRWSVLPKDPLPLRVWLRAKQAENPGAYAPPPPPEPLPEEDL